MEKYQSNIPFMFLGNSFPENFETMNFQAEAEPTSNTIVPTVDKNFYNDFGDLFAEDEATDGEKDAKV